MDRVRTLPTIALLGAIALLGVAFLVPDDWGPPGTESYRAYELVNRIMGIALAACALAPVSVRLAHRPVVVGGAARVGLWLVAIGMIGMAMGSAAEFWIFSGSPYQGAGSEGRNIAFVGGFMVGSLLVLLGSPVAGVGLIRDGVMPRWIGLTVLLATPAGIVAAVVSGQLLLWVPLSALALGVGALVTARGDRVARSAPSVVVG
jgi:hypothetical protein